MRRLIANMPGVRSKGIDRKDHWSVFRARVGEAIVNDWHQVGSPESGASMKTPAYDYCRGRSGPSPLPVFNRGVRGASVRENSVKFWEYPLIFFPILPKLP